MMREMQIAGVFAVLTFGFAAIAGPSKVNVCLAELCVADKRVTERTGVAKLGDGVRVVAVWAPLYSVPAALGCLLVRRLCSRAEPVLLADWLNLILPWLLWFACVFALGRQKSLSNLGEAYLLSSICTGTYWIRLKYSRKRYPARRAAAYALTTVCLAAVLLATLVPALPE
jgi:hypothetical protein